MATIDLNARRAERARARAAKGITDPTVTLGEETYTLPPELPFLAAQAINRGDDRAFLEVMFGDRSDEVVGQELTVEDIEDITKAVLVQYSGRMKEEVPDSSTNGSTNGGGPSESLLGT